MQFGAKPLFENVSVRFGEGNRYGLIAAEDFHEGGLAAAVCADQTIAIALAKSHGNIHKKLCCRGNGQVVFGAG